jgi:creatinine amidohydrolase
MRANQSSCRSRRTGAGSRVGLAALTVVLACACASTRERAELRGVMLGDMTWDEAARALRPDTVVVLPLGAGSKEHGLHLRLSNDETLMSYLVQRVLERCDVVVAPPITYAYYPAFEAYPGSISISLATSRDLVVEACRSLARHGPKLFYVLNTGVSTRHALGPASEILAREGIALRWTNLATVLDPLEKQVAEQPFGSHADEIETSMMLYIAPETVDMSKAVRECNSEGPAPLVRDPTAAGTYSKSGCYGDPTLATREKGRLLMDGWVEAVVREIEDVRHLEPPFAPQGSN